MKDEAVLQARNYLRAIKGGMAENSNVGILDQRICCIEGHSYIYGHRDMHWELPYSRVEHRK